MRHGLTEDKNPRKRVISLVQSFLGCPAKTYQAEMVIQIIWVLAVQSLKDHVLTPQKTVKIFSTINQVYIQPHSEESSNAAHISFTI